MNIFVLLRLLWSFFAPSVLMGVGIAIDVALATVSKFRDESMTFKNWTLPIMATHILFPAVGYYGFWELREDFKVLSPALGILGFLLVFLFVFEVVCNTIGREPFFGISAWLGRRMGLKENDSRRFISILAVSWDALWSGPAKAAQAQAGRWTTIQVLFSFVIAGLVVAVVAQAALLVARSLRQKKFQSVKKMASSLFWGKYLELSVIGGFGILSLQQALISSGNIYFSIAVAALLLGFVWLIFASKISQSSLQEAEEAIE